MFNPSDFDCDSLDSHDEDYAEWLDATGHYDDYEDDIDPDFDYNSHYLDEELPYGFDVVQDDPFERDFEW